MIHFLVGVVVSYVIRSHPVSQAILLTAHVALLSPIVAGIITAVVAVGMSVAARDELRARRQWHEDEALLRNAALRWARREPDG